MFFEDCHVHTTASPDAEAKLSEQIKQAEMLEMNVLTITDHVEINRFFSPGHYGETPRNEFETYYDGNIFEKSVSAVTDAKKSLYKYKLKLYCGVEMGQNNSDEEIARRLYNDVRVDFVIGSLHELLHTPDFWCLDYNKLSCDDLLTKYFDQLYNITEAGNYDVLGHITYPLRYMVGEQHKIIDLDKYMSQIEKILRVVIVKGKGIELNTSGLRQEYGKTFPDVDILKLYKKLGGEIITIGSDAHKSEELGKNYDRAIEILHKCGFDKICYFDRHKPVFINI